MNEKRKNAHWTRLLEFLRTIGWSETSAENEVRRCKEEKININWDLVLNRTGQSVDDLSLMREVN